MSEEASDLYEQARRQIARFIGARPQEIVFVKNATEGLNLVASGLGLNKHECVLVARGNHHSNLVPWMKYGSISLIEEDSTGRIAPELLVESLSRQRPKVFSFSHSSNTTGAVQPAETLCFLARDYGALTVVDASQSAPHLPIDVGKMGCDFLVLSGHKMLGPMGIGVLFGRHELLADLQPLILGGGALQEVTIDGYMLREPPARFEAGTPNISGALGLSAAVAYINDIDVDTISAHSEEMATLLYESCCSVPGLRVLGCPDLPRLPIISFAADSSNFLEPPSQL